MSAAKLAKLVPAWAWLAGAGVAALAVYAIVRKPAKRADGSDVPLLEGAFTGIVKNVEGVGVAAVKAAAGVVGVPDTNAEKCQVAQLSNDALGVQFYCPASDYIAWLWENYGINGQAYKKPAATTQKSRVLTSKEKQWPYVPVEDLGSVICGGKTVLCGPTFEGGARVIDWLQDGALFIPENKSFDGGVLSGSRVVSVAGLRG